MYKNLDGAKFSPFDGNWRAFMTVGGYTKKSGCPTDYKVKLEGETRWRRVYNYCISNSGTLYVKVKGEDIVVCGYEIKAIIERKQKV